MLSPHAESLRGRKDVSEELAALNERHTLIKRGKITPHEVRTKTNTIYKGKDITFANNALFFCVLTDVLTVALAHENARKSLKCFILIGQPGN